MPLALKIKTQNLRLATDTLGICRDSQWTQIHPSWAPWKGQEGASGARALAARAHLAPGNTEDLGDAPDEMGESLGRVWAEGLTFFGT